MTYGRPDLSCLAHASTVFEVPGAAGVSDGRGVPGAAARAQSPDAPLVPGPRQHKAGRRAGLRKRVRTVWEKQPGVSKGVSQGGISSDLI